MTQSSGAQSIPAVLKSTRSELCYALNVGSYHSMRSDASNFEKKKRILYGGSQMDS